ncbi:hypothetical protein ABIE58_000166 [Roseovarius sp. MBR-78]|jgi:hypothetical protein|uniref:RNA-directed DNA polymerase n=1 Tax=Roseovarius sp. MBR-78 TaxID=3156460 RepID=UPI003397CCBD
MTSTLDGVFLRKVWRRLRDSQVPIVSQEIYSDADNVAKELSRSIKEHLFLPSTIHGYLGIQKGGGVTRFLPILTAEDMGVYYYLCYRLAPKILEKQTGIFGAWHMQPLIRDCTTKEIEAEAFGQGYWQNPFSSKWWLREWRQFNDLIRELLNDRSVGKFVVATDVANFYDSIEVPRLIGKVRQVAHEDNDTVEALNAFLSSWNRRHIGYMPSTKGIPQEIISDASRVLSHFYLQQLDVEFNYYCKSRNLTYIRWSDDILVFGGSKLMLEKAVHHLSRLMRDIGLNLNAAKTRYMSKTELKRYRALDFLSAVSEDDNQKLSKEIKIIKSWISSGRDFRIDTVFRALIGFLSRNQAAQTSINRAFIADIGEHNRDLLHSLNNTQLLRYIQISDDPIATFHNLRNDICKAQFGGPKASYLHMLRKYRNQLSAIGMTKPKAISAIYQIEKSSDDSEVIRDFCVPAVREQYS